jgi:hypothetical protein
MDWTIAKENAGSVFLNAGQRTNAEVVVNKGQDGQTILLAASKPYEMPDDFNETATAFNFDVLDILWVEVFSENHDDYQIYAIEIKTSTPTIADVTLGGRSAVGGILPNGRPIQQYGTGLGTPNAVLASATDGEIWFGTSETGTLAVEATPEDSATIVLIATGAAGASETALFPAGYTSPAQITPVNGNYLYIKAVSADADGETIYYKLKIVTKDNGLAISGVTLQAAGGSAVPFNVGVIGTNGFGGGENHGNGAQLAVENSYQNIIQGASFTANVTVNIGTVPNGSTIRYGHTDFFNAQEGVEPPDSSGASITLTYQESSTLTGVTTNEYIAVEVTNALGDKGWYAFRVAIGNHTDITALTVGGEIINIANAKNDAGTGTKFVEYRPVVAPDDIDDNSLWDSLAIAATGQDNAKCEIVYGLVGAEIDNASMSIPETWQTTIGGGGTLANELGTGTFLVIRVRNVDKVDYYYKVQVAYGSTATILNGLTINGQTVNVGVPGILFYQSWGYLWQAVTDGGPPPVMNTYSLGSTPDTLTFVPDVALEGTARFGFSGTSFFSSVTLPNEWSATDLETDGDVNRHLMIEVTSEDKTAKVYYRIGLTP